jgi:DNA primase
MALDERTGIADLYERDVLPALTRRLDAAFPEFGWQRDPQAWRATNQAFTHATFGVRADRVVCHGDAPRGFLIHGQGATLWTTYVNGGQPARGRDFVNVVRTLAERAGLETAQLERPATAAQRQANLLHDTFVLCQRELTSERGAPARAYLEARGIPSERVAESGVGVMPEATRLRLALTSAGYRETEIANAGVLADSRWAGRIVGAWRDEHSNIATLWARTTHQDDAEKYLYLRGARRPDGIPYGLTNLITNGSRSEAASLLLVEGVLDVHILRANGIQDVAALGGTATSARLFEQLAAHGISDVTLALDNDPAGVAATHRATDSAIRADRSPRVWVIDPDLSDNAKDPGEIIQRRGPGAWERTAAAPVCGITAYAVELAGPISTWETEPGRRAGLARATACLATLHPRHSVEQAQALDAVADTLDFDIAAVRRTFRAHHWQQGQERAVPQQGIDR